MRTFTLKGLFLTTVFMLLGCLAIHAADDGLITEQVTVKLDKAGTLRDRIFDDEMYNITKLKIVGDINGSDVRFIREMAGRDFTNSLTDGKLESLDLVDAKIVGGGEPYFETTYYTEDLYLKRRDYYTSNDSIGAYFFYRCSRLTSVIMPLDVKAIGDWAFGDCNFLPSIDIPSGVISIGDAAFSGCSGLTKIDIPSSVISIGDAAFSGCSGLTKIDIPSSVNNIGNAAFCRCSGLTDIVIPTGVKSIGYSTFAGCI